MRCLLQLLNQIVCELPPDHPVSNVRPLRDSLGHTPLQVCGILFLFVHVLTFEIDAMSSLYLI